MNYFLGIDVGSTTVKTVLLNEDCEIIHKSYDRHFAKPKFAVAQTLSFLKDKFANSQFRVAITGSAGLGISKSCNIDFVQEVFATSLGVKKAFPKYGNALSGWEMGFEPTVFGTTIRRFNQLSYTHHIQ